VKARDALLIVRLAGHFRVWGPEQTRSAVVVIATGAVSPPPLASVKW